LSVKSLVYLIIVIITYFSYEDKFLKSKTHIIVVFVSNREDFVFDALKIHPFAFVRKIEIKKDMAYTVKDIISLLKKRIKKQDKFINLEAGGKTYQFNPYKIMYAEVDNKTVTIVEKNKSCKIPYKLTELMTLLDEYNFVQTHRTTIVNCLYIYYIDKTKVVLDNGKELPLSKYKERKVREKFCKSEGE
jgi:DNA-binding LytR/AlgR family response regulator